MSRVALDLAGKRFGRLRVIEQAGRKRGSIVWRCLCDCGTPKLIPSSVLAAGATNSCGCLRRETSRENMKRGRERSRRAAASTKKVFRLAGEKPPGRPKEPEVAAESKTWANAEDAARDLERLW